MLFVLATLIVSGSHTHPTTSKGKGLGTYHNLFKYHWIFGVTLSQETLNDVKIVCFQFIYSDTTSSILQGLVM